MKRDDCRLGSGISSGDDALWIQEDGSRVLCHVLKVHPIRIKPDESGNVLIEVGGEEHVVYGSELEPA